VTDREEIRGTAADFKSAVDVPRGGLPEHVVSRADEVLGMLREADDLLDPDRPGERAKAYSLVAEAERILREELGQMSLDQEFRYAALDAHKRLYRRVLI
jgi:hypothetical protein